MSSATISSQAFALSGVAEFTAAINATFLLGASQIVENHVLFEPVCVKTFPAPQSRSVWIHPKP
jgi:hypothetical protein